MIYIILYHIPSNDSVLGLKFVQGHITLYLIFIK